MNFYRYFKELPGWAKGVVVVGGAAVTYFAALSIYKGIKKNQMIKDAGKAADAAKRELTDLAARGVKPTMTDSQFQSLSESLVQAMTGCGTDENRIFSIFYQIKNDADIRKLIAIFGVRAYDPCGFTEPIDALFEKKSFYAGLPSWLSYDLSASDISSINTILKTNKVNYSF